MQIKIGQSDSTSAKAGTVGGLLISAYLQAAATNTPIVTTDFLPASVQVSITLARGGQVITIMNSNLLLLGTYAMRKNNLTSFVNGEVLIAPAVGVDEVLLRSAWLKFGSPLTLQRGDVLTAQVQFLQGAITANIDSNVSYLDFSFQPATTKERGIPQVMMEVVNTNTDQQNFIQANGISHIEFMNFDKTNWELPVMVGMTLQSDKLNYSASLVQLIASENYKWPSNQAYQYGATQFAATVTRNLNMFPQMLTLYEAGMSGVLLNNCVVAGNFQSAQVAASQNWIGYTKMLHSGR